MLCVWLVQICLLCSILLAQSCTFSPVVVVDDEDDEVAVVDVVGVAGGVCKFPAC